MAKKLNLTEKNPEELKSLLSKEREELRSLRFAAAGSRPKDSSAPSKSRKMIARLITEMHVRKQDFTPATEVEEVTAEPA